MNYKNLFDELKINTVNDCYKFLYNILYGWLDKNGNIHSGVNDANLYSLQSPDELAKNKVGICWDITEFTRAFFETMTGFKFETYYLFYDDNAGCPSHTFLVYYDNGKVYYFEPMYNDKNLYFFSGIHEFDSIDLLLDKALKAFIKSNLAFGNISEDYDLYNFFVYKYEKPKYHINGYEVRNHINNSEKIEVCNDRKTI